ncbi:MAG: glutathione S-transferase [Paracoccaceae bacterium]|nr:glutathione S-transferase [Paracoccaceae bacterium]
MSQLEHPILYNFRRCPYAIRARLALLFANVNVEIREVVLKNKPAEFLATSPSGTVPSLKLIDTILDESLDIMEWALSQYDPINLMDMPSRGFDLITECDGDFKQDLDRAKYLNRFPETDPTESRDKAALFLYKLENMLSPNLFGKNMSIADLAILPFVRQFAHIDHVWFYTQGWINLINWLDNFKQSSEFNKIMIKLAPWQLGDTPVMLSDLYSLK